MESRKLLRPDKCGITDDIRTGIDQIDRAVVGLIGRRYQCVMAAAKFKTPETAVEALERFAATLSKRREWAVEEGLNADMIEKLRAGLVVHFIDKDVKHWTAEYETR